MAVYNIRPLQRDTKTETERRLLLAKDNLVSAQERIAHAESHIAKLPIELEQVVLALPASAPENAFLRECAHEITVLYRIEQSSLELGTHARNVHLREVRELQEKNKALATEGIVWDTNILNTELQKTCKFYVPDSLEITQSNEIRAKWKLTGVRMKPTYNPYINVQVPDNGILLPDIEISYYPNTGKIFVTHVGEKPTWDDGWGGAPGRVHPHIMSGYEPCFGNFAATKFQCTETADIISLNLLMLIFLQTANTEDSSGKHWPSHITQKYKTRKTRYEFFLKVSDSEEHYCEMLELPFYEEKGLSTMLLIWGVETTNADDFEALLDANFARQDAEKNISESLEIGRRAFKRLKNDNTRITFLAHEPRSFADYGHETRNILYGVNI